MALRVKSMLHANLRNMRWGGKLEVKYKGCKKLKIKKKSVTLSFNQGFHIDKK